MPLFLDPIDLAKNEIQNVVAQNLGSDPGSPATGQFWFNTTSGSLKIKLVGSIYDFSNPIQLNGQAASFYLARGNHSGTQLASTISDFNAAVQLNRLDQLAAPTADVSLNSRKITSLLGGTVNSDAATYGQLLNVQNGTYWLNPVLCVATGNVTALSGEQTFDGITTSASRVLLTGQSTATQNGLWVTASGAWTRPADFAAGKDAADDSLYVQKGTTFADTQWRCTTDVAIVGTNNLTWTQFAAGVTYSADGSSVTLTGSTFSINTGWTGQTAITTVGTIVTGTWNATVVAVLYGGTGASTAAGARTNLGAMGRYSALIGDGSSTTITITQATHGLATSCLNTVALYDATTGAQVYCNVTVVPASGNVTLTFTVAPTTGQYRVVIIG